MPPAPPDAPKQLAVPMLAPPPPPPWPAFPSAPGAPAACLNAPAENAPADAACCPGAPSFPVDPCVPTPPGSVVLSAPAPLLLVFGGETSTSGCPGLPSGPTASLEPRPPAPPSEPHTEGVGHLLP